MLWNRYCIIVRISPNWPPRPSCRALAAAGSGSSTAISLISCWVCRYIALLKILVVNGTHGVSELLSWTGLCLRCKPTSRGSAASVGVCLHRARIGLHRPASPRPRIRDPLTLVTVLSPHDRCARGTPRNQADRHDHCASTDQALRRIHHCRPGRLRRPGRHHHRLPRTQRRRQVHRPADVGRAHRAHRRHRDDLGSPVRRTATPAARSASCWTPRPSTPDGPRTRCCG